MILSNLGSETTWGLRLKVFVVVVARCNSQASLFGRLGGRAPLSSGCRRGIHSSNGPYLCHGNNRMVSFLFGCHFLFDFDDVALRDGVSHRGCVSLHDSLSLLPPWCRELHGSSLKMALTAFWCFGWSTCHGFVCDLSLFLALFCSFISSILCLFLRSNLQYSFIISKSLLTVFGLCLSRYSPYRPRFIPRIAAR